MWDESHGLRLPAGGAGIAAAALAGATDFLPPNFAAWALQRAAVGESTQTIFEALNAAAERHGLAVTWTMPFLEMLLQHNVAHCGGAAWCTSSSSAAPHLLPSAPSLSTPTAGVAQHSPSASPSWASTEAREPQPAASAPALWRVDEAHEPAHAARPALSELDDASRLLHLRQSSQLTRAALDAAVRASGQLASSQLQVSFAPPSGSAVAGKPASQGGYASCH